MQEMVGQLVSTHQPLLLLIQFYVNEDELPPLEGTLKASHINKRLEKDNEPQLS